MEVAPSREGGTDLWLPGAVSAHGPARRAPVFYNPAMRLDRDLGVAFARAWTATHGGGGTGWDMLAATGVRGLRVLNESGLLRELWLTDANPRAAEVLDRNALRYAAKGARALVHDSRRPLSSGPFDYVDLDPYGTPVVFLPTALDALRESGALGVTATDMMVLTGVQRDACEKRYGGEPVHGRLGPEGALRILLAYLARCASDRKRSVRPLMSYVHDHYVRTYLWVDPPDGDSSSPSPIGTIDPSTWEGPRLLSRSKVGPLWLGPLFDSEFVRALESPPEASYPREVGRMIQRFQEESRVDTPFYYESNSLAETLKLASPPSMNALLSGLRGQGWPAAGSHMRPGAFRTSAPRTVVEGVARSVEIRRDHSQKARVRA